MVTLNCVPPISFSGFGTAPIPSPTQLISQLESTISSVV